MWDAERGCVCCPSCQSKHLRSKPYRAAESGMRYLYECAECGSLFVGNVREFKEDAERDQEIRA